MKKCLIALTAVIAASFTTAHAESTSAPASFDLQQKAAIEQIIHDYLVKNPKVLVEASSALQKQQMADMQKRAQQVIPTMAKQLFNDPSSPVLGNPKGSISLVEFFDYQCSHCKEMMPVINQFAASHPNVRLVYKELPIFGKDSDFAARAALAALKQGKYEVLHQALMKATNPLTNDTVLRLAKEAGLNVDQLKTDMATPAMAAAIKANYEMATALGLVGTPAFIMAKHIDNPQLLKSVFYPGVVPAVALQVGYNQLEK